MNRFDGAKYKMSWLTLTWLMQSTKPVPLQLRASVLLICQRAAANGIPWAFAAKDWLTPAGAKVYLLAFDFVNTVDAPRFSTVWAACRSAQDGAGSEPARQLNP